MNATRSVRQPLLPRVSLAWLFVGVTGSAVLVAIVRSAEQGGALVRAVATLIVWLGVLFSLFAILFCLAYLFGILESVFAPSDEQPSSPFANDALPQQQVQPSYVDER